MFRSTLVTRIVRWKMSENSGAVVMYFEYFPLLQISAESMAESLEAKAVPVYLTQHFSLTSSACKILYSLMNMTDSNIFQNKRHFLTNLALTTMTFSDETQPYHCEVTCKRLKMLRQPTENTQKWIWVFQSDRKNKDEIEEKEKTKTS